MSRTNSTEDEENWILLQVSYDYIAIPVSLGVEVMNKMLVVSKNGKGPGLELVVGEVKALVVSGEQITLARVKAKMLPKEGGE